MRPGKFYTKGGGVISNLVFQNYHRHSFYTNPIVPDSVVSNEAYAIRAKELGHGIISTMEHGNQGRYIEGYNLGKKYDLKFLFGAEAYWVKDRTQPDATNCHIYIGAKNENGRQAINDVLSEANLTGFYRRARLDIPLILSLPKNDVWVTTACVAYWQYEDVEKITKRFANHFGDNFYLEVQYHNTPKQAALNRRILQLRDELRLPIIMGCDSHYIFQEKEQDRTDFLASKEMHYDDEDGWFMDYPDGETAWQRFEAQGVLSQTQIEEAMSNTNVFLDVKEYDSEIFNNEIKIPSIYQSFSQVDKDEMYESVVWNAWDKYKKTIPEKDWPHHMQEITAEIKEVRSCGMADYFLLNNKIIQKGKENGGWLTKTGRGSAVSFVTNMLLGFTEVDRVSAKVKMYPERFLTSTRILESGSLPDIDFNVAPVEPFARAQKEILGEDHAYPMISYGTMQNSAAWKLYAKSQNVPFDIANAVSSQIKEYEEAVKQADEDEKNDIDPFEFIDPQYHEIFEKSADYRGIISSWSIAPCGYLLYQGGIRKQIGLVRIKDHVCCMMDGKWAEENHFLKNDLLKVSVVDLIYKGFHRIGMEPPSVNELLEMCPPDDPCWSVYARSCCLGINQVEKSGTASRVGTYKPTNISELSAFVAAIRPGFKSMYRTFEQRQDFSYGVKAFDDLMRTEEMPQSFCMYQEQEMAALNYAGIPMSECYTAIKNIAKKRKEKVLAYKEKFMSGFTEAIINDEGKEESEAIQISESLWKIVEDSASYSFNCCLSGNSRLKRPSEKCSQFKPTIKEMFLIKNDKAYADRTGHSDLHKKYNYSGYTNAYSMCSDGRCRPNKIVDIRFAGVREVYRVTTESGAYIDCTDNHKFPTPNGERQLKDLSVGDLLYCVGLYEKNRNKYLLTNGIGHEIKRDGMDATVVFNRERKKHVDNRDCCECCGAEYTEDLRFELHHIDFNRLNNNPENYQWLCVSCHKKAHYANGRVRRNQKGYPVLESKIVSITYLCTDEVFDVEMEDPYHTVISDSGLISCNSHSYCVACDSLYSAWLKAHHPVEFYETLLRIYEEKGEKDKMQDAIREASSYFQIRFPPMRLGQDNRSFVGDSKTKTITASLQSIKGFGSSVGDTLFECGQQGFTSVMEAFDWLFHNGIREPKVLPLIKVGYFDDFGNQRELIRMLEFFLMFWQQQDYSKQVNREGIDGTALEPIVSKYANGLLKTGQPAKRYKILDPLAILKEIETLVLSLGMADLPDTVKIQNYNDVTGSPNYISGKDEDRRKLYILKCRPVKRKSDGKQFGYNILGRSIGSGKETWYTILNRYYNKEPIKEGDMILCISFEREKSFFNITNYKKIA